MSKATGAPLNPQTALEPYLRAAGPLLVTLAKALDQAWPHIETVGKAGFKAWEKIAPYKDDWGPLVFGLLLMFFGGSLPMTIAAVEAFRLCGWAKTRASAVMLWEQFKVAKTASDKDNLADDDKDGIADVKQIAAHELLTRKVALFFKVTDPAKLNEGLAGLAAGSAAVMAVLRNHFAQSIALGTSLGDIFTQSADKFLHPTLLQVIPKEYHKWIPMIISYSCRSVAITIAWWCQRIISAMHSATRGSDLLLKGVFALLLKKHITLPMGLSPTHDAYPAAVTALGVFAFWYQLSRFFGLPFPFNVILMPLRLVEGLLAWSLAYNK